jgi:pimeloyl-ACP methyl ester carboxylesterase
MGGRLALHVALAMPERVARLVLLSTSAGIADPAQRAERRRDDEALAAQIERGTIEEFIARWRAVPLFADDPPSVHAAAAADERRNAPADIAAMLRGFGPGVMEPVWERLGELEPAATVLAGERDERYRELGQRLAAGLPRGEFSVVAGAGHRLALQAPDAVARALAGG